MALGVSAVAAETPVVVSSPVLLLPFYCCQPWLGGHEDAPSTVLRPVISVCSRVAAWGMPRMLLLASCLGLMYTWSSLGLFHWDEACSCSGDLLWVVSLLPCMGHHGQTWPRAQGLTKLWRLSHQAVLDTSGMLARSSMDKISIIAAWWYLPWREDQRAVEASTTQVHVPFEGGVMKCAPQGGEDALQRLS